MPRRLATTGVYEASVLDYDDRPLAADEALVRTEFASGKHGTTFGMFNARQLDDMRFDVERHLFVPDERNPSERMPSREDPWRAGTSGVGLILAVGTGVTRFRAGERVFGLMDISETNICAQDELWHLGELQALEALCIEPAYVAFHCVRESNLRYGDRVAVIGLGALGLLAVSIARSAGTETLIAVDPLPKRRALAAALGADHTLDPRDGDVGRQLRELSGGTGVDIAIELSGSYAGLSTAITGARVGGLVCSAGFYQGAAQNLYLGREWHHNRLTMLVPHGCGWGHEPRDYPYWDKRRAYDAVVAMMRRGSLNATGVVNRIYSLEEATQVFQHIREQPNNIIKYAVDLSQ